MTVVGPGREDRIRGRDQETRVSIVLDVDDRHPRGRGPRRVVRDTRGERLAASDRPDRMPKRQLRSSGR